MDPASDPLLGQDLDSDELPQSRLVFGPLNFGAYVPVIAEMDIRLQLEIINLSKATLSNEQVEVLGLGLQFRNTPKTVPYLHMIPGIEAAA